MDEAYLKYGNFWERLGRYIRRNDLEHLFDGPRQLMEKTEPAYDKARSVLDPQTEDDLVLYIAGCEQFCRAFALAAYDMGLEEGLLGPKP